MTRFPPGKTSEITQIRNVYALKDLDGTLGIDHLSDVINCSNTDGLTAKLAGGSLDEAVVASRECTSEAFYVRDSTYCSIPGSRLLSGAPYPTPN